jgi:PhoPQ-activated pathogenicity-related protein
MVRAAVAAMDAAVEIARTEWRLGIEGFVVTGASKRGWTSWLTTAIDPRVVGVVPQVIDMLSMGRHLRLQTQSFGGLSDKLTDYTSRGIEKLLGTPRGRELIGIVDPFTYRDRLTAPKLISLGTNDPYWPLESLDLYRGDLPGPCWVSYCPNAGHGIPMQRWGGLVVAMGKHVSGDEPLPELRWRFERAGDGVACVMHAAAQPERAVLWQTESATRDFRQAKWLPAAVAGDGPEWEVPLTLGAGGGRWKAAVVEVHYPRKPIPLVLTTSVHVLERKA